MEPESGRWWLAFLEFFVVLAFAIGWLILEWQCKRIDRRIAEEKRLQGELSAPATDAAASDRPAH